MNIKYRINGRDVTPEEFSGHGDPALLAEMLESRQAPRALTDDVYMGGIGNLDQQIPDEKQLETITRNAIKAGYKPKHTDFYNAQLADFEGDPKAFLNHGMGRGELKKRIEAKGMYMDRDGDVHSRGPDCDPYQNPVHKLNPRIVKRIRKNRIKENPELARSDPAELDAEIVQAHGWNKDK